MDEAMPDGSLPVFLDEVRAFLATALTPDLRAAGEATTGVHSEIGASRLWHRRLHGRGWIAPAWPRAFGGTGWTAEQRFLFEAECAANDAPILFAGGIRSLGPLLIACGTEDQRRRYLPAILDGSDLWAQGFSEACAGSDLVAVQCKARRDGDGYRVSGRKLWTTGAHHSSRMFSLVRTASAGAPHEGLTFLLIDMAAPGLEVRPIVTIDGEHEFNEVVLDDVFVPVADRVGEEGEGWDMAKRLMRFARSNNTNSSSLRRAWRALLREADMDAPEAAMRLAQAESELVAFEAQERRLLATGRLTGDDEVACSMMKTMATELHQRIAETALDLAGPVVAQLGDETPAFLARRKYLAVRAASIYSGTSEIHRNIIGRQLWRGYGQGL